MPLIRPQHSPVSKPIRISYDGHRQTPFVAVSPGKFDADCIAVPRNHPPVSSWWAPAELKPDRRYRYSCQVRAITAASTALRTSSHTELVKLYRYNWYTMNNPNTAIASG